MVALAAHVGGKIKGGNTLIAPCPVCTGGFATSDSKGVEVCFARGRFLIHCKDRGCSPIHPQIGGPVNEVMNIQGHQMRFRTIDLTTQPDVFEQALEALVA